MLTISICAITAIVAFFCGYFYRAFFKERNSLFPASAAPPCDQATEVPTQIEPFLSEPFSAKVAEKMKINFERNYNNPQNRFTRTVFLDLKELKQYLDEIEPVFERLGENGMTIRAIGAYFALTQTHIRGSRRTDIVIPADKLAIFLAPVLYEECEIDDPFPNPADGGKRKIVKKDSVRDVFSLIAKGEFKADEKLAFDISHTEP